MKLTPPAARSKSVVVKPPKPVYRPKPHCVAPNALSGELCTLGRDAKHKAERIGFVVESGRSGYRVVDFHHPTRIYSVRPGPTPVDEPREVPGQMTLAEV
jgi:hypothetical protein